MQGLPTNVVNFFIALMAGVAYYNYPNVDPNNRAINVPTYNLKNQYDFIIVGAGSAGCVLANRLTEISNWTVLLLEVGMEETVLTDTPLMAGYTWYTPINWNYTTVPQSSACRFTNGVCEWPRGKVIGGSSTINFMVYSRGNRRDYDGWAAQGNDGWSYDEVLPYFRLSEDNRNAPFNRDTQYHSTGGYLTVSSPPFRTPLAKAYLQGGRELGYQVRDANGAHQTGFMILQGTLRNGSRCSTGKAFLRPVRNRPNLHVAEGAFVTRINFEGDVATSVTFVRNNEEYNVSATKEIIISAGSINTPQLLMLSGIGPADHLQDMGIPVLRNLSVGYNLNDHYGSPLMFETSTPAAITAPQYENIAAITAYSQPYGTGPLTSPFGIEALGFLNSSLTNPQLDYPDIEIHFTSYYPSLTNNRSIWFGLAQVLHPKSRGRITLASTNPYDYPNINPNYFGDPRDMTVAVEALMYVSAVANTTALQQLGSSLALDIYPNCTSYAPYTYDFYECVASYYTTTIFHPSGTCKMGPAGDPNAVVSPRLRVHGLRNLRVIDASVMPWVTGGNTNAPTIMIAERGADYIKAFYNQPTQIPVSGGTL